MLSFHKKLLAAAAVASLGLSAAVAGPWGGGDCPMMGGGPGKGHGRMGGDPEQRMAMKQQWRAERMELLQARLKLKPEQETAWKSFIAAQDAHSADKMKMRQTMRDQNAGAVGHFENRIQGMEQHLASMKAMAKATGDLYAALDADQKKAMDDFFANSPRRGMRGPGAGGNQATQ
ncbi:MAG: Spy/CpxP family protein refolding chaperone [Candidatus Competibacteraceae bacterium]|nr:Spy/CpxP family protein refolding chaperone [Candidatus Competibacteraceae bacterium]